MAILTTTILTANNQLLGAGWNLEDFVGCKTGLAQHVFEFGESVGIAGGSIEKHGHAEGGGNGRCDAIRVGNEFERGEEAAGSERGAAFAKDTGAFDGVEVMQEISEIDDVIADAKVQFERVSGAGVPAIGDAELHRVFGGDGEYGGPVHGVHFQARMSGGGHDAKNAVTGGDVEQAHGRSELSGHELRGREHHGHHALREVDPDLILNVQVFAAVEESRPLPHDLRNIGGGLVVHRVIQKPGGGTQVHARALIEEGGGFGRQAVGAVVFGEEAGDGEIVAENARAAFAGAAAVGDGRHAAIAFADGGKQAEINAALQSGRLDVGHHHGEDSFRGDAHFFHHNDSSASRGALIVQRPVPGVFAVPRTARRFSRRVARRMK